jgi:hypothetical protein
LLRDNFKEQLKTGGIHISMAVLQMLLPLFDRSLQRVLGPIICYRE